MHKPEICIKEMLAIKGDAHGRACYCTLLSRFTGMTSSFMQTSYFYQPGCGKAICLLSWKIR